MAAFFSFNFLYYTYKAELPLAQSHGICLCEIHYASIFNNYALLIDGDIQNTDTLCLSA